MTEITQPELWKTEIEKFLSLEKKFWFPLRLLQGCTEEGCEHLSLIRFQRISNTAHKCLKECWKIILKISHVTCANSKSLKSQSPRMAKDYTVFIGFCLVFFLPFLHLTYKAIMAGKNLIFNFIFNILYDISYIHYVRLEDRPWGWLVIKSHTKPPLNFLITCLRVIFEIL